MFVRASELSLRRARLVGNLAAVRTTASPGSDATINADALGGGIYAIDSAVTMRGVEVSFNDARMVAWHAPDAITSANERSPLCRSRVNGGHVSAGAGAVRCAWNVTCPYYAERGISIVIANVSRLASGIVVGPPTMASDARSA